MQRKCHRCDRLYTPTDHNTWCPDCMDGKPIVPRKTAKQVAKENRERMEQAYKYARYCVQCGKRFYTNKANKMICGNWQHSKGCIGEWAYAKARNIKIYSLEEWEEYLDKQGDISR